VRRKLEREPEAARVRRQLEQAVEHGDPGRGVRLATGRVDAHSLSGFHGLSVSRSVVDALDARAEGPQPLVDPLVAAVDLADVADHRGALGRKRGYEHRHAGTDVRALEPLTVELRRARDDRSVRVAEDDPRAHADQLVDEEQATLEHLLEDEDR